MSIETRVATARAALIDMGRPDLASDIISAEDLHRQYPGLSEPPISWRKPFFGTEIDDEILIRRAAAIASLAEGYDERNFLCEPCCRLPENPGCELVTRREFIAHVACSFHPSARADPPVTADQETT